MFRADKSGDRIVCWGNGEPKAVVQMILGKPPHVFMDCYGSGAGLQAASTIPMSEWVHVIHTCKKGDSRLYVNGRLDGVATTEIILAEGKSITVTATADNGGKPVTQAVQIAVKAPAKDVWVQRIPDKDEKPVDNLFFARDDNDEGTLYYNGTLTDTADSVFLKLYADGKLVDTQSQKPKADRSYALADEQTRLRMAPWWSGTVTARCSTNRSHQPTSGGQAIPGQIDGHYYLAPNNISSIP